MEKQHKDNSNLLEILDSIPPGELNYQEWCSVGMALKDAGFSAFDWDNWSKSDHTRYVPGDCERKWESFRGTSKPVTAASIVKMAMDRGLFRQEIEERAFSWEDSISYDGPPIVDSAWLETEEMAIPEDWEPEKQLISYLETLFTSTENVGYVTDSWEKDGKYFPKAGSYTRTAGELIDRLAKCKGDIGAVLGDYNPEVGAWIRFNPLDGKGIKNENVVDFRYALVESDSMEIEQQNAIIRALELPVATLTHSGGKSLHAIVRIEAGSYEEYRKRVDYLYTVCAKNGLKIDTQNRNPSRLSRMPGVTRKGSRQYLIDRNIGKSSWAEWYEWVESVTDELPDPESLADSWNNPPPLAPPLIENVLRKGHKMLVAGPSKAGKSYMLIALCCAITEGKEWLGFKCAEGGVLYVNLELDRASCIHRFKEVKHALGYGLEPPKNLDIWHLRGKSVPMDKLAPMLIRRAKKKAYTAVVIDPIYKVITGDENSADQMAHFCNQFDKVCTELGCAVIYCHHHSKGGQGGKKSMDRASGSGVFARDPDALLDLLELEVSESLALEEENSAICKVCKKWLDRFGKSDAVSQDDLCSKTQSLRVAQEQLAPISYSAMLEDIEGLKDPFEGAHGLAGGGYFAGISTLFTCQSLVRLPHT